MSKFGIDKVINNLNTTKRVLPVKLANQAVNHFSANFQKQGFETQHWKEVKRRTPDTPEYKYPKRKGLSRRTKPILVGTGRLRRAVAASKQLTTFNLIKLVVDLPYAARHNDGLDNMPERTFMRDSIALRTKQIDLIDKEIDKIWQA